MVRLIKVNGVLCHPDHVPKIKESEKKVEPVLETVFTVDEEKSETDENLKENSTKKRKKDKE